MAGETVVIETDAAGMAGNTSLGAYLNGKVLRGAVVEFRAQRNFDPIALDQTGWHGEGAVENDDGVLQVPFHGEVERHRFGVRHRDLEARILDPDGALFGHTAGHSRDR